MLTLCDRKLFFLPFLLLIGTSAPSEVIRDPKRLPQIQCPLESEALSFSLKGLSSEPKPNSIEKKLPGVSRSVNAAGTMNVRLDLCRDGLGKVTLKRVLYHESQFLPLQVYTPDNSRFIATEGLSQAIFQDHSKLRVVIKDNALEATGGLVLQGIEDEGSSFVAVVTIRFISQQTWRASTTRALVGVLELGDAFAAGKCELNQVVAERTFTLETAKFHFNTCEFMVGEGTRYVVTKVSVTDHSPKVSAELRGKEISFEGEELKNALKIGNLIHNGCDSFALKVTQTGAHYAATAAPMAGCGAAVEGAPQRDMDDNRKVTLYEISYGGISDGIKSADFWHYFFGRQ